MLLTACSALAADGDAVVPGVAPAREFERVAGIYAKDAPSQDVVDRLYDFMEKYPKDPRSDRVQLWVALTQQKRKFHNEAIKEFNFVINDFPNSPLVVQALRAQIDSYAAIEKSANVAENYAKILDKKPADFAGDPAATAAYGDAVLFTANLYIQKKEVDAAVKLLLRLPSRTEAISRVVQTYIAFDRHEDALTLIRRLSKEERPLAYRLTLAAYSSRPGTANLFTLLNEVIGTEPPAAAADALIQQIAAAIGAKGPDDKDKVLRHIADKYDRLRRWAHYGLCDLHKTELPRLITFIGDYRTGGDVEKVKVMVGELHESRGDAPKAREAYWLLDNKPAAHFLVAATYYGKLAKTKDLPAGQKELTEIVKRFYSPTVSAEALLERADLESGLMAAPNSAIATLRELLARFPREDDLAVKAIFRLGSLLRVQKKQDEAIAAYERLVQDYAGATNAVRRALMEIANCYEEKNDSQRAVATYRLVMRKYPHTPEASHAHTVLEQRYDVPDVDVSDR
ncbi:MAG: tetratricopeptide repeat protein [Tepidisphaeraceae bacterium]|jgi:TolA-binding protein